MPSIARNIAILQSTNFSFKSVIDIIKKPERIINKKPVWTVKPNFKEVGKIFGPKIKLYTEALKTLEYKDIQKLENNESLHINIDGTDYEYDKSGLAIRIPYQAYDGE